MGTTDNTGRRGVNAVEAIFLGMQWIFRDQPVSDFGVDAHVEIVEDGKPTGRLIALQIKAGSSWFRRRGERFVYRGKARHLAYWENHSLPVLLVLHDPDAQRTVWTRIERHRVNVLPDGHWTVEIPARQTLTPQSADQISRNIEKSDPESIRRRRLALDAEVIREVGEQEAAYVRLQEWVNKSLNFRGADLYFDDPDVSAPVYEFDFYYPAHSVSEVMTKLFPWLAFRYCCPPEEGGGGEIMIHTFEVELNELARAFLLIEDYYHNGAASCPEPEIPESDDDDEWDEDDWNEFFFQEAMRRDD